MKIRRVDLRGVILPLTSPFASSAQRMTERESIIVAVHGEGMTGYAECVAGMGPWYTAETIEGAAHIMTRYLIPLLLSEPVPDPRTVWERFASVRGNPMAKAALEMAVWDLFARVRGVPLARLLGGVRDRVPVGVSVGMQNSPDATVEAAGRYVEQGYARVKIKIAPGRDLADVRAVRMRFPQLSLQVDANSAYTLAGTPIFRAMDPLGLLLIEQPFAADDFVDHRRLQEQIATPLCLDEGIDGPEDARQALELSSCRVINLKPGRVGGHTPSLAIERLCRDRGAGLWCGGMLETNIGRAHNVALASLAGFTLPGDISASNRYYQRDIAGPDFELNADSTLTVPDRPGIGVEPDAAALAAATRWTAQY